MDWLYLLFLDLFFSEILNKLNITVPAELLAQFFILMFFVYALRKTNNLKSSLTSAGEYWKEIFYLLVINFLFGFFVLSLLSLFAPDISNNLFNPSPNMLSFIYVVISTVIIVPIIEELMFRGVILNALNNRVNFIYAIVISSVLFSLFHGFGRLTPTFFFGLCMCVIYLKTNNITIPIIIHVLNNALGTICTDVYNIGVILTNHLNSITFIISTVSGILILFYLYKNIKTLRSS